MTPFEYPEFIEKYKQYEREGGVIDFRLFSLDTEQSNRPYNKHLAVAQQTLISVAQEIDQRLDRLAAKEKIDRSTLFTMDYDFASLKNSGKEITPSEFIGGLYDDHFKQEAFAYAFLKPPYSFLITQNDEGRERFFWDFCQILFTDISQIEVYQWSTDCSNYFDEGKDWWGTFFWTVYNPYWDSYIGILAATTD